MIFDIGYLILITALLISIFGIVVGFWGGHTAQRQADRQQFQRRLRRRSRWFWPRRSSCGTGCLTTISS